MASLHTLVLSTSLNPDSKSRVLSEKIFDALGKVMEPEDTSAFVDLREFPLPLCDGDTAYGAKNVSEMAREIGRADCIIVGFPVYNFTCSAALKNLIELTGRAWENKIVGFVCAAGGKSSYMSVMSIANSLMLDFRCLIVPRFVYSDPEAFAEMTHADSSVERRLHELAGTTVRLARSLSS